mmetsp:Transcript_28666/g.72588  ORF Transcript_28666/g.72588 Transcript_28666/m.72588 type:complete len:391 (+) Transcript_28666:74-1246(+)|eukprot:CAMPEP_0178988574 /NCGR_PEP_ID=MMETSP0795-20121207/3881_1 /TAXON_ID=88552 /ORGANISM="Amoebophrya sp., Strain Ameob2" /LENGTH=390 /DNA_ID=CAMNT_0020679853 /DNA_START=31 /DNA_END=1203 /DNA_ORIENTATION=-
MTTLHSQPLIWAQKRPNSIGCGHKLNLIFTLSVIFFAPGYSATAITPALKNELNKNKVLGIARSVQLVYDTEATGEYGLRGQWLLKENDLVWKPATTSAACGHSTASSDGGDVVSCDHAPSTTSSSAAATGYQQHPYYQNHDTSSHSKASSSTSQSGQSSSSRSEHKESRGVLLYDNSTRIHSPIFTDMSCQDSKEDFLRVQPFITNSFRNIAEFKPRRCGDRPLKCGRIVFDDVLPADVLESAYKFRNFLHMWEGTRIVKSLLEKHFDTEPLQAVGGQLDQNIRADLPCEMHTDYLSRPPYYFLTAIIYLVDQGKECSRCETVFNDDVASGKFEKGVIVQPRKGRVALFSGGVENMHCKMPSTGKRDVVQIWFQCSSEVYRKGVAGMEL